MSSSECDNQAPMTPGDDLRSTVAGASLETSGSLVAFFLLTYALMWACFIPVATSIPADSPLGYGLLLLGAFAPSIVALGLTMRQQGEDGAKALLSGVVKWRVPLRWYVFAVLFMVVIKLTAALIYHMGAGVWPRFGSEPWYVILPAIAFSTPFQAGEEIGWRGYALPRLAKRMGLAPASLVLGVIWGCWHLPQFFIKGADTYRQSFALFMIAVTAVSVAIAFLWERTGGSLLLPMLMQSAMNNSKDIVPSSAPGGTSTFGLSASWMAWVTLGLLWICAIYFLMHLRRVSKGFRHATQAT